MVVATIKYAPIQCPNLRSNMKDTAVNTGSPRSSRVQAVHNMIIEDDREDG